MKNDVIYSLSQDLRLFFQEVALNLPQKKWNVFRPAAADRIEFLQPNDLQSSCAQWRLQIDFLKLHIFFHYQNNLNHMCFHKFLR